MKKSKTILLILCSLFMIYLGCGGWFIVSRFLSVGIYESLIERGYETINDITVAITVYSIGAIIWAFFCSIPIWEIEYKSEKERMKRQIISIVLCFVLMLMPWIVILLLGPIMIF